MCIFESHPGFHDLFFNTVTLESFKFKGLIIIKAAIKLLINETYAFNSVLNHTIGSFYQFGAPSNHVITA